MSDIDEALAQAVGDACKRHPSDVSGNPSGINRDLWAALDQIGITLLSVPEEHGGAGGEIDTAVAVLQVLGQYSAQLPYAETALLAGWLLAESGAPIPDGPMTAAAGGTLVRAAGGWRVDAELARVPWARHAEHLVLLVDRHVVTLMADELEVRPGSNLAGEPRDDVSTTGSVVPDERVHALPAGSGVTEELFAARRAVGRLALSAGAARRSLELSIAYAAERRQFGRSLDRFQSVQQQIASLAGEVLLVKVAAEGAARSVVEGASGSLAVPAACVAVGQATGTVARIAHQIHGAIGFTEEHDLRHSTTRLWSWREELGSVPELTASVGDKVVAAGGSGLWPLLADGGPGCVEAAGALQV